MLGPRPISGLSICLIAVRTRRPAPSSRVNSSTSPSSISSLMRATSAPVENARPAPDLGLEHLPYRGQDAPASAEQSRELLNLAVLHQLAHARNVRARRECSARARSRA